MEGNENETQKQTSPKSKWEDNNDSHLSLLPPFTSPANPELSSAISRLRRRKLSHFPQILVSSNGEIPKSFLLLKTNAKQILIAFSGLGSLGLQHSLCVTDMGFVLNRELSSYPRHDIGFILNMELFLCLRHDMGFVLNTELICRPLAPISFSPVLHLVFHRLPGIYLSSTCEHQASFPQIDSALRKANPYLPEPDLPLPLLVSGARVVPNRGEAARLQAQFSCSKRDFTFHVESGIEYMLRGCLSCTCNQDG
ncbi:hypothetical protein MRB53_022981 [Persea americana]|uniref:Uncharacterized protein n=1 Tax=Persea americana TaxID=3435 RepID=A0ACC2L949_PERAE|nr:hypothetical protein MRB53_022981 [Persea americana]